MTRLVALSALVLLVGSRCGAQQRLPDIPEPAAAAHIGAGYRYVDSTGSNIGFSLGGGYLSYDRRVHGWLGLATEAAESHAANISGTTDSFTLATIATGPRVTTHIGRLDVTGQLLLGFAHASQSHVASTSSYAGQYGAGLNYRVSPRFSLHLIDLQELQTGFNGGSQHHLMVGSGLLYNVPARVPKAPVERSFEGFSEIFFTCGTEQATVAQGGKLPILGHAYTEPDLIDVDYSWGSTGGKVVGAGRQVELDTTGMAPGEYMLRGRAFLVSSPATYKDCHFPFRVVAGGA